MNPFAKIQMNDSSKDNLLESKFHDPIEEIRDIVFNELDYIAPQKYLSSVTPSCRKIFEPKKFFVEKSMKTLVIFESNTSLSYLKSKLSDPNYLLQKMKDPGNDNLSFYYRYPDTNLPLSQKKNIHKALSSTFSNSSKADENLIWYKMFSEKWRKALLSAYETLKHGLIDCFYFVQENLTVLFERDIDNFTMKAYMQLASLALAEDLKNNGKTFFSTLLISLGIEYKILSKIGTDSSKFNENIKNNIKIEEVGEEDENENSVHEESGIQMKRSKTFFTKENIVIEGILSIAELVDFLINQKDRNSYAILPEIYSPGPFIYGTLRSNLISFSGECKGTDGELTYQLKINGIIFPDSIWALFRELTESGHNVNTIVERNNFTDFLSAYPHISEFE
jgi:hypothetical protein